MHILYNIVQRYEDQIAMNILTELDKVIKECEHNVVKKVPRSVVQVSSVLTESTGVETRNALQMHE